MLKRPIKFKNFDGEEVTEVHYFNLSETDLIDMEVEHEGGLKAMLERLIEKADRKGTVAFFRDLVLTSYGEKSEDGRRFIKTEQTRLEFSQTGAYNALFMELATNDKAAAEFLIGIVPKDMVGDIEQAMLQDKTASALTKAGE